MSAQSPRNKRKKSPQEKEAEKRFFAISDNKKVAQREFKNHLKGVIKHFRDLDRVTKVLYAAKAKHQARWPNGRIVEKKDLRQLQSQFVELIDQMALYRKYANMRAPTAQKGAARYAPKLAYIQDTAGNRRLNMTGFFQAAEAAGLLNGPNGERPNLSNLLSTGWTTGAELGDLFIIYVHNVGLQDKTPKRSKFLLVAQDPLFMRWFGDTLADLESRPVASGKKRFDRNNFSFINLQQIISNNATSGLNMNDEQFEVGKSLRPQLLAEAQNVGAVKQSWDTRLAPQRDALKRQQQEAAKLERARKAPVKRVQVKPAVRSM